MNRARKKVVGVIAAIAMITAPQVTFGTDFISETQLATSSTMDAPVNNYMQKLINQYMKKYNMSYEEAYQKVKKMYAKQINAAGTYSDDINGDVIINVRDVELSDMTVKGDLYLGEGIGDGDAILDHITVEGTVYVEGGGEHSIKSKYSDYYNGMVVSAKNPVRIVNEGEGIKIETVSDIKVTLTGVFDEVIVGDNVTMNIQGATVDALIIEPDHLDNRTPVAPRVNIDANSKVEEVQADTAVNFTGTGYIGALFVNSTDVTCEQIPEDIKFKNDSLSIAVGGEQITEDNIEAFYGVQDQYRIHGRLTFEGEAVPYTSISVFNQNTNKQVMSLVTDVNGNYSFYGDRGETYYIECYIVDEDNYGYYGRKNKIVAKKDRIENLDLEQQYVAVVKVVDQNGVPVKNALVYTRVSGQRTTTNDLTKYNLSTDNYGEAVKYLWDEDVLYGFDVYFGGKLRASIEPTIAIEEEEYKKELTVTIPLSISNPLEGNVVDEDGNPVVNDSINLYERVNQDALNYTLEPVAIAQTDENGHYSFSDVDVNKAYYIGNMSKSEIEDEEEVYYMSNTIDALLVGEKDIQYRKVYNIKFKAIDSEEAPISNVKVQVFDQTGACLSTKYTNAAGITQLRSIYLIPGKYTVLAYRGNDAQVRIVEIKEDQYNYVEIFKYTDQEAQVKKATVNVPVMTIDLNGETHTAYRVALKGEGFEESAVIEDKKATISIPVSYDSSQVDIVIYDENDVVLATKEDVDFNVECIELSVNLAKIARAQEEAPVALAFSLEPDTAVQMIEVEGTNADQAVALEVPAEAALEEESLDANLAEIE